MTQEQAANLHNGVYRLYWKEGGNSVAAVGKDSAGHMWNAPSNWVSCYLNWDWDEVVEAELIQAQNVEFTQEALLASCIANREPA